VSFINISIPVGKIGGGPLVVAVRELHLIREHIVFVETTSAGSKSNSSHFVEIKLFKKFTTISSIPFRLFRIV
jgi:hypothetical protein